METYSLSTENNKITLTSDNLILEKQNDVLLGGKNQRDLGGSQVTIPGMYKNKDAASERIFIKLPKDEKELFCELLHGEMIAMMKLEGLLPIIPTISGAQGIIISKSQNSKVIGLKINILNAFNEIYTFLGSAKKSANERDNFYEIRHRGLIAAFLEKENHGFDKKSLLDMRAQLATVVFLSIALFGDYSVHSSNIGIYDTDRIAKIDGGAAFRQYGLNNPKNILKPAEYEGVMFYKEFYKDYVNYYTRIPGFNSLMGEVADNYMEQLFGNDKLNVAIERAINNIKNIYKSTNQKDPFENKKLHKHFAMNLNLNPKMLATQFSSIMLRNIKAFQNSKFTRSV